MENKKDISQNTLPEAACPGQIQIPTPKEKESLDAMRSIKERVQEMGKTLRLLKESRNIKDAEKIPEMEVEVEKLKSEWRKLEKKWKEDVRERMIYLGHEET